MPLNKYFYRPLASLIIRLIYNTRITPNELTVSSFLFGIAGSICFLLSGHIYLVIGAVCIQLAQLLDVADGMLARSKNIGSNYGAYLDLCLDRVTEFLLFSGISIGLYLSAKNIELLIIGFFTIGLFFLQSTLFYLTGIFYRKEKTDETEEARALLILLLFVFALLDRLDIFIYLMFIETSVSVLVRLGFLVKLRYKKPKNETL